MKIIFTLGALLFSITAFAAENPKLVRYAEVSFACQGTTPDFTIPPALNLANLVGEQHVGLNVASAFSLVANQIIFIATGGHQVVIGTLSEAPTCTVEDTGEDARASWNQIILEKNVILDLGVNTLNITDLSTAKLYQMNW